MAALQGREVALYSDLLLHRMGPGLDDGIGLGQALPDEYRTRPLWGYRLRRGEFLHGGEAGNLHQALLFHGGDAAASRTAYLGLSGEERYLLEIFLLSL